ncbi:hypothetical protein Taro_021956 [Colocasia esculenta]|uniref:Uncharacterized protein n=1 Tax=Colocasia esculenta TaxID=4460 RepID=A0A843V6I5_COLES|nr:hypothetical protein [Colocasia esculenta]
MSGGGSRAVANQCSGQPPWQILQPLRRHLPFPSSRPPFVSPGDYHRFSTGDNRQVTDEVTEVVVVRTPVQVWSLCTHPTLLLTNLGNHLKNREKAG